MDNLYDFDESPGIGDLGITGFGMALGLAEEIAVDETEILNEELLDDIEEAENIIDQMDNGTYEEPIEPELISLHATKQSGKATFNDVAMDKDIVSGEAPRPEFKDDPTDWKTIF